MDTTQDKPIIIQSMFDGKSHHGAFRCHLKHRWKWWLILRTFVCILLISIGAYFSINYAGKGEKYADFTSVAFILLGSVGLIRPMVWQMFAERKLRQHPAYQSKIQYIFSTEGVKMSGKAGDANVTWPHFYEVVETQRGLLIYQSKKEYLWIPANDFQPGQMTQITSFYASAI